MKALLSLAVLLCAFTVQAQRVSSLRIFNFQPTNLVDSVTLDVGTNELARVLDFQRTFANARLAVIYREPEQILELQRGAAVLGPATVRLFVFPSWTSGDSAAAVVELSQVNPPADAQKTAVAPAGYPVTVSLESSTNLVTWQTATNGAWPASDAHRFFRVNLKLSPKD